MATRNYNTETTSQTTNHSTETTTSPVTTLTSTASPVTTKKPLHISIGVNYRGFIKYTNITDITTLSGTTT